MNRAQRAKAVVGALGGGKKAQKAVAKTGKAIRAGVKGDKKKAARAAGGAIKNIGKTTAGREQRKKFFG